MPIGRGTLNLVTENRSSSFAIKMKNTVSLELQLILFTSNASSSARTV